MLLAKLDHSHCCRDPEGTLFAPESCHGAALPQTPHWSTRGDLVASDTKVLLRAGLATAAPLIRPGVGELLGNHPSLSPSSPVGCKVGATHAASSPLQGHRPGDTASLAPALHLGLLVGRHGSSPPCLPRLRPHSSSSVVTVMGLAACLKFLHPLQSLSAVIAAWQRLVCLLPSAAAGLAASDTFLSGAWAIPGALRSWSVFCACPRRAASC